MLWQGMPEKSKQFPSCCKVTLVLPHVFSIVHDFLDFLPEHMMWEKGHLFSAIRSLSVVVSLASLMSVGFMALSGFRIMAMHGSFVSAPEEPPCNEIYLPPPAQSRVGVDLAQSPEAALKIGIPHEVISFSCQ